MTQKVDVADPVSEKAEQIADNRDVSRKEAFGIVFREAGYKV